MNEILTNILWIFAIFIKYGLTASLQDQTAFRAPDDPVASWPHAFSIDFTERTFGIGLWRSTTGSYHYDSNRNATMISRKDGSVDRYCSSLFRGGRSECRHLVVDGTRWLVFPRQKYCCACCTVKGGCGIVKNNWLENAQYLGREECPRGNRKDVCDKWNQPGLQPNLFWANADTRVPARLFQKPNDDMIFDQSSFSPSPPPSSEFDVPEYCSGKCPRLSICGALE